MKYDEHFIKIRHENLKHNGVSDPVKVDNFVDEIYTLMKERNFSIIESEWIAKYLSNKIENDKKIILREPLKNTEKFNRED